MAKGKPWQEGELFQALTLYFTLPFGKLDANTPAIIHLAKLLERTPGSVAMKLNNFASLDPKLKARGIKGLDGASKLDRETWTIFTEAMRHQPEILEEKLSAQPQLDPNALVPPIDPQLNISQDKDTTKLTLTKTRVGQSFFRNAVLSNFNGKCCISGLEIKQLLRASHILPWSQFPEHRLNPENGLLLSPLYDAAFDNGFLTIDDNYRVVLGKEITSFPQSEAKQRFFLPFQGIEINLPEKYLPNKEFLKHHQDKIFESKS